MATQIQIRRDTAGNWAMSNPVLAQGELGLDLTTGQIRIGDGIAQWTGLSPFQAGTTQAVSALPASPVAGLLYLLDTTDPVARAAPGSYVHRSGYWRAMGDPDVYAENASAAYTIPPVMGQTVRLTLGEACSLAFPAVVSGASFRLQISNSDAHAIVWPAGLVYDGGSLASYTGDVEFVVVEHGGSWRIQVSASGVAE